MTQDISYGSILKILKDNSSLIHFIGIGGVSMYSLARLSMLSGARVSGSDIVESKRTLDLSLLGAKVSIGHRKENVGRANLVVYNHAISRDNPELTATIEQGIPAVTRDRFLGALMSEYSFRIGVSGSHGKSTTVAMLDAIFSHARTNPTVLSGSELPIGYPLRVGGRGVMIYEACEYRDSFLRFSPTISIGLNLELDHTDYFPDIGALKNSFSIALGKASKFALINGDDENLADILDRIDCPKITYGSGSGNQYTYSITSFRDGGFDFSVSKYGSVIGNFKLNIPGSFNLNNAVAAIICAIEYGIDIDTIGEAIENYRGIAGRLEYIGQRFSRPVYYDYAHHPTEIRASINCLKMLTKGPVTVVFKPHTFSRTASLWDDFCSALSLADRVILTDIYPARESPIDGITSERLAEQIGDKAIYSPDEDILTSLDLYTSGVIVLMGAGDFEKIKKMVTIY